MVADLVNLSNNPQKPDPPFILFPQVYDINGARWSIYRCLQARRCIKPVRSFTTAVPDLLL